MSQICYFRQYLCRTPLQVKNFRTHFTISGLATGLILGLAPSLRGFLFSKFSETPIVHVPKLFPLLHWFQNTFCFLSSSTPSHVGKFFRLQWEFQWENDQNKKNGQKSLFRGPKWFPKCLNGGFRGGICIEKWS